MGTPSTSGSMAKPHKGNTLVMNSNMGMTKTNPVKATTTKAEDGPGGSKSSSSSPNQKGIMPNASAGSATQHHSILRIGPRLRAEGLMVPPASDAATLRRQVAALQIDLEAHIEGEQRLQKINQQLRERLELYMKQNHENVERAEKELNALHEDMEQTLELQRRLAQRATALEKEKNELEQALHKSVKEFEEERSALQLKICTLTDDLKAREDAEMQAVSLQAELESTLNAKARLEDEIHNYCAEADSLKQKADKYSKELQALIMEEKRNQTIAKHCKRPLLRRMLYLLREAAERQREDKFNEEAASAFSKDKCRRRGLRAMHLAAVRSNWMKKAQAQQSKACLREVCRAWLLLVLADKKFHEALKARKRSCMRKAFGRWNSLLQTGKLSPDDEQKLTVVAKEFWQDSACRRVFKSWMWWMDCLSKPRKLRLSGVRDHMNRLIQRQTLAAWRLFICLSHENKLKKQKACEYEESLRRRRFFCRWQEGILVLRYEKLLIEKALQFNSFCSCRSAMKSWWKFLQMRRRNKACQALAFRHYIWNLQLKVLVVWRHNVKFQQAEVRAVFEANQALMKAAIILWREHHVLCALKKQKERKVEAHRRRRALKLARVIFLSWWEDMAWKRRALQLEHLLASRRQHTLLVIALHSWMHSTFENLLLTNAKIQNDLFEAKALFEEQKHQTTAVDVENLQLIDRLHTMSSEIAYLKMTKSEKEKQEEELHRALEDGAFIESSMRGELEQQHIRIEELELNILSLQKKLQCKNAEDTAEEVHHTLEIQNMEQAVNDLQIQLAEKSAQLKSYEEALKETAEKLEGASDESQEKLSSAFKIASSLRKLLEDRENQYATLEGTCRRKELELEELQRKLAVANNTFSETVEARDARIQELEAMLAQKHNDIHDIQQEMQELRLAFDAKDNLARKLEYEMKLKSDEEVHNSKHFVSSLSTWPVAHTDPTSGLRSHVHSIQMKESMRHVYTQAKAALQKGGENKVGPLWDSIDELDEDVNDVFRRQQTIEELDSPEAFPEEIVAQDSSVLEKAATALASYKDTSHTVVSPVDDLESGQPSDWETPFSFLSTARPTSSVEITEAFGLDRHADDATTHVSGSEASITILDRGSGSADDLNVQIKQLQERIKSHLRDSHSEEKARTRLQQKDSPTAGQGLLSDKRK